jgi:hypothetical protein
MPILRHLDDFAQQVAKKFSKALTMKKSTIKTWIMITDPEFGKKLSEEYPNSANLPVIG